MRHDKGGLLLPTYLLIQRKSTVQNLYQRGPISPRKFTQAAYDFILRQHRQLMNSNRRGRIQAGLAPLLNRDIEVRNSETRGNGSPNEIIVSRVEEDDSRTQFAPRRLVEVDPNQDDLTGSKCHGSAVRRSSRQ